MIIYKELTESKLLLGLKLLESRMGLNEAKKKTLIRLEKGMKGEKLFYELLIKHLKRPSLVLANLLFRHDDISFQIDCLVITSDTIYLYEVKHLSQTYQQMNTKFITKGGYEFVSPLQQVEKTELIFKQMLKDLGINLKLVTHVVFTHEDFYLYNDTFEDSFLYLKDLEAHFDMLNRNPMSLPKRHHTYAQLIISALREEVPYQTELPPFEYSQLKKGLSCPTCASFNLTLTQRQMTCQNCQTTASLNETIIHTIEEYKLLFPDEKVRVTQMYDWCGKTVKIEKIRKLLKQTYQKKGSTKAAYYV